MTDNTTTEVILDKAYLIANASNTRKTEKVFISEMDGFVFMKQMNGTAREKFEDLITDRKGKDDTLKSLTGIRPMLIQKTLVNQDGTPMFAENERDQINELSAPIIDALFNKAQELNGIGEKGVEQAEKNSDQEPASSGSDSPDK